MFDQIVETSFPDVVKSVGVTSFKGTAYPKINVYEWDTKEVMKFHVYQRKTCQ